MAGAKVNHLKAVRLLPVVCENSARVLRGLPVVELEQAAEPLTAPDRACAGDHGLGRDALVAQPLVRPFLMIMLHERSDGSSEVPFAEGHDSRQALGLGAADIWACAGNGGQCTTAMLAFLATSAP